MKVKVEKQEGCRRVVHVETTADEVLPEYESVVQAFAKSAKVKGFRPGRAPRLLYLIRKRLLWEEVAVGSRGRREVRVAR